MKEIVVEGKRYVRIQTTGCTWCAFLDRPTTCTKVVNTYNCTEVEGTTSPDGFIKLQTMRDYSWIEPERLIKLKLKGTV